MVVFLNLGLVCFGLVRSMLVLKQHEGYFGTDLAILNRGQITSSTPELSLPSPNFRTNPAGRRLVTTCDLTFNSTHTLRIFSGIGSRTWKPEAETIPEGHRGVIL
ncbi:hypothetical protein AVEN_82433-1 [Araneus ventricosus]|uniref:Secreted protein n=1 Tax=Araneus ventricosus TaxID=182803 RepID=A0A4Y2GSJ4_ARAVE|nr:hypothetical protein AVEN_82433-1 [Araneus ventricosus]